MIEVFLLHCKDASHLGGPMGTEYTTHLWTLAYTSEEIAQKAAEDYAGPGSTEPCWQRYGDLSWDSGGYIFSIERVGVFDSPHVPHRRRR